MIYYTGDIHGSVVYVTSIARKRNLKEKDTIVVLGDVGANYYGNEKDRKVKEAFARLKPVVFCVHGNHEMRPQTIPTYKTKEWNGGIVWYEEEYPNVLFAKDGEIYEIDGIKHLVIGGAYSVDKYYRLARGFNWWSDEQPTAETKAYVEHQIREKDFEVVLSHTCPLKYEPIECFLPGIDQSTVDKSTEEWLDKIEESADYKAWYCGHWHINKHIDKMHFLFHDVESSGGFYE